MMQNELSIDEIRDRLAIAKGYTKHLTHWHEPKDWGYAPCTHPFPRTLDGADSAFGNKWHWTRRWEPTPQGSPVDEWLVWIARHEDDCVETPICPAMVIDTGNKVEDLFRLAWACHQSISANTKESK